MKTKEYPSLGMTLAFREGDERQSIIMKQVGELPLGQHLFDEEEMRKLAEAIGDVVEEASTMLMDRAVVVGRDVNDVAAYAFIYLAAQGIRDHVGAFATSAIQELSVSGTALLQERLGDEGLDRLISAVREKRFGGMDPTLAAVLAALGLLHK